MADPFDPRPYIASQAWARAKTVPEFPHEYLPLSRSTDRAGHLAFLKLVRHKGRDERFADYERPWRYLTIDGFDYWVSGPGAILNRRLVGSGQRLGEAYPKELPGQLRLEDA